MVSVFFKLHRISILALTVILGACSVPYIPPPTTAHHSDRQDLTEMFNAGYRNITEKYIDPVTARALALDGLDGLSSIDPDLSVKEQGDLVTLSYSGNVMASVLAPEADNTIGWAALTTSIIVQAKSLSSDLNEASDEKLFEAVYDGILSGLDINSRYAGATEAKKNRARRDGFGGVGLSVKVDNNITEITDVSEGKPAHKAGLKSGDIILKIDGESTQNLDLEDVLDLLRGRTQTIATLTISSPGQKRTRDVALVREHIVLETVTEKRDHGVLYLKISSFNQETASSLKNKLIDAKFEMGSDLTGLVIDLRGNPGGLLKQSVEVAHLLLTHGTIVSTQGRHQDSLNHYEAGGRDLADGLPIIVLVDGKSASAAEIVAAALQDRERAVLIGTSTYGKGTVQTVIRLPNDGEIYLTWSRFVTPSGYPLHGLGVRPVVCTSTSNDAYIESALKSGAELKSTFESWRAPLLQPEAVRSRLRKTCPPEKHQTEMEMELAKQVFSNSALYGRTLDLSARSSQARK